MRVDTEAFAEFYGALLGDGCIYSTQRSLCISGNSLLDSIYLEKFLKPLATKLFGVRPLIYYSKNENSIRLVVNNTRLVRFLLDFGFPSGLKKKSVFLIPEMYFQDSKLLAFCLRGIIDTDGGVYPHKNCKIMLDVTSRANGFLLSINRAFEFLELGPGLTKYKIQLYGSKKIEKFFSVVGSNNLRNAVKYYHYLKFGTVPTSKETERLLNGRGEPLFSGPVV